MDWGNDCQPVSCNDVVRVRVSAHNSSVLPPVSFRLAYHVPFRSLTGSSTSIKSPATIATLTVAVLLIPAFIIWVKRQEDLGRPALIPSSIWRNRIFTSICINVFLIWGAFNAFEQVTNFFFQSVQKLSPLEAALRFLPAPISGAIANLVVGFLVPHTQADWIVIVTAVLAGMAPLLMAVAPPSCVSQSFGGGWSVHYIQSPHHVGLPDPDARSCRRGVQYSFANW